MSVAEVIERLGTAGSAPAEAPTTTPVVTEEPKALVIPAEEPPTGDTPAVQPEVPTEEAEAIEEEPNLEEQPESSGDFAKYKPLFKDNPELRNILGREKAFSELGNFSDVREIITRVPTLEDAEALTADADTKRTFSQTYREDPTTFVESLKESDPLAFQQFAAKLPDILAQTDERLWVEQATVYTTRVLSNAFQIAQNTKDEALANAVQLLSNALGMPLGRATAPTPSVSPELERLRREKAERDQQDAHAQFDTFWKETDAEITEGTLFEIEKTVKQAVPTATPAQLKRMVGEVYNKTRENLQAQPQFNSQIATYRANAEKGRVGLADRKAIADFGVKRAKLVIPKAAKEVISEWTGSVIKASNTQIERKQAIAKTTKDVGAGPQGTSAVNPNPGPAKRRTLNDVYKEIESRIRG